MTERESNIEAMQDTTSQSLANMGDIKQENAEQLLQQMEALCDEINRQSYPLY
ncbi:hypothetical protein [Effusibacillus dendaii]|uniref:Uncharacterized protein n=1 Tax=Effusibacillus dendaii TaxID=2743772 RepID=A0A7I8DCB5_9BACL|nr:hypothetical protein [Effusibacillus dendaii]BCJ86609.1 hypothetical protein skT53_15940 [Effusibacillus dendaii]